jgi:hypothetical protein
MTLLAHILMVPVEEVYLPLASGVAAGTALWLAALLSPLRTRLRQ